MPVKQSSQLTRSLAFSQLFSTILRRRSFVLNAINSDPEAEAFTEHLATKWLRAREVIPVEILAKRDAEALADTHPDAYFEKFEERNAFLEAEPGADPESYFRERDAQPEAYFEKRDAIPGINLYETLFSH